MGAIVLEKKLEIDPGNVAEALICDVCGIGLGGVGWRAMSVICDCLTVHPVIKLAAKIGTFAWGCCAGDVLGDYINMQYHTAERINGLLGRLPDKASEEKA